MSEVWTPEPRHLEALQFVLERSYAGLMMNPGLGKTSVTLAAFQLLQKTGEVRRALVVAPIYVAQNTWPDEARKWFDFRYIWLENLADVSDRRWDKVLYDQNVDIVCINPESLEKILLHRDFHLFNFDMLVIDESTKFKDSQTRRFKTLRKYLGSFKRRVALTGTPAPNGLVDLFGQAYIIDRGAALGEYITHFRKEYCFQIPGDPFTWHLKPDAPPKIMEAVKPILLRMTKGGADIPIVPNFIEVRLPDEAMRKYRELDRDFITTIGSSTIVTPSAAAKGIKLRQLANGFAYYEYRNGRAAEALHEAKLLALEELLAEMQGRPLLLAYEFQEDAARIAAKFGGVDLGRQKDTTKTLKSFNKGDIPLLLAHPASAGYGLNLQEACSTVCWYGPTWNLEHYIQFNGRIARTGQSQTEVVVHHIIAKGTRDIKVMAGLKAKAATQDELDRYLISPIS